MKLQLLTILAFAVLALPVSAALKEGDTAPDFSAQASLAGKSFQYSLQESLKNGPVVVYFYPSAYTQDCNIEAHTFSENADKFKAAGTSIVGVSLDNIERLNAFSADPKYCAGKLPVASDADGRIAHAYQLKIADASPGAKDSRGIEIGHAFAERTTFVVLPGGKISGTVGGVTPSEHVHRALEIVQKLHDGK